MRAFYTVLLSLSLLQRKVILKFPGNLFLCVLPCWRRIHNCQSCHNFQIKSFRRQTCPLARVEVGASELICGYECGRETCQGDICVRAFCAVLLSLSLLQRKVILKFPGNLFSCVLPCWRRIHNFQSCHNFQIESFRRQTCPLARVGVGAPELICGYERGRGGGGGINDGS